MSDNLAAGDITVKYIPSGSSKSVTVKAIYTVTYDINGKTASEGYTVPGVANADAGTNVTLASNPQITCDEGKHGAW